MNMLEWNNRAVYKKSRASAMANAIESALSGWTQELDIAMISRIAAKYGAPEDAVVSAMHIVITKRVIESGVRLKPTLRAEHERDGLRVVSQRHNLPPWRLLTYMYPEVKYSVSDELKADYDWARENDADSPLKYDAVKRAADDFENTVGQWLDSAGIGYHTQTDLVKHQTAVHGRAVATPDFLLKEPTRMTVTQHGKRYTRVVNWIDCKNYMLIDVSFIVESARRQAEKYNAAFGPGAFLYRWGFSEGIRMPCVLMDWSGAPGI